ncbi:MAG: glycosyltransferase, partial [Chloroflexota bacterium]|nr:glycosyltransferase [Chloroflexota bacterium]
MSRTLIIFAREPIAGCTKTRLCPPLDHETAATLYSCFLRDTLDHAGLIPGVRALIAHTPESD